MEAAPAEDDREKPGSEKSALRIIPCLLQHSPNSHYTESLEGSMVVITLDEEVERIQSKRVDWPLCVWCVCVIVWREVMFVYLLVVLPGYPAEDN
ncbi:hypothetical protein WR25_12152 [Diploscapter pachys]|uniref:Uncharacterized protein n=1 Tax=Diploscapter pachys TaxID=2018661 RepID=A0A2A2LUI6_9BILA|nr:hypothetical protein WR25_12152 [Diploscapter pachys]